MDELIVDLRHQNEILKLLDDEPELQPRTREKNDELDLMLVGDFPDLGSYAARVRRQYVNELTALGVPDANHGGDLDVLLYDLRVRVEREFGFVPLMERNADSVIGLPQHKSLADPVSINVLTPPTAAPTDGRNVKVGVVDTALVQHPDFPPSLVSGTQFVPAEAAPPVLAMHSTFVVGLIRHQAPAAKVLVRGGLDAARDASSVWRVAVEIASLKNQHLDILNLSLGITGDLDAPPVALRRAIDRLGSGVLVVAAAGNRKEEQNPPRQVWPAAMTDVIAVGAINAIFSLTGPWVDCVAPGVHVESTFPASTVTLSGGGKMAFPTGLAKWTGTSFAAATVSGAVAARMSQSPGMTAREAFAVLLADEDTDVVQVPTL